MSKAATPRPVKKAVFPVAGLGTRFLPATKAMPKEMLTICDRPLIQHVVEEAREAGIEEFIFITGRHKELLEEHFDLQHELEDTLEARGKSALLKKVQDATFPAGKLILTRQPKPLGLGHAVWCAARIIGNEPFAVLLPDVLMKGQHSCLKEMVDTYNKTGGNLIAVEEVRVAEDDASPGCRLVLPVLALGHCLLLAAPSSRPAEAGEGPWRAGGARPP